MIESEMDVKIQDEGQTGIKEVTGSVPMEEKIYAVCTDTFIDGIYIFKIILCLLQGTRVIKIVIINIMGQQLNKRKYYYVHCVIILCNDFIIA